jgi:anthranilate synthase component II
MKLLIVDNNDSFTYNLVQLVAETGLAEIIVINHAELVLKDVAAYDKVLFSPGPSLPDDFPIMKKILASYAESKSILGICMGMQAMAEFYGGGLYNLNEPVHGQKQQLQILKEDTLFTKVPQNTEIGLSHSWAVLPESLPNELEIIARNQKGVIMALRHKTCDVKGLQFHPESIITEFGSKIIGNWLRE